MIPKVAPKSSPNLTVPVVLSLVSILLMVYGFFGEGWWIGLGFVFLTSTLVGTLISYGASNSKMDTRAVPGSHESERTARSA